MTTLCKPCGRSACPGLMDRSSRGTWRAFRGASCPTAARSPSRGARRAHVCSARRWCCSWLWRDRFRPLRQHRLYRIRWPSPSRPRVRRVRSHSSWRRCAERGLWLAPVVGQEEIDHVHPSARPRARLPEGVSCATRTSDSRRAALNCRIPSVRCPSAIFHGRLARTGELPCRSATEVDLPLFRVCP